MKVLDLGYEKSWEKFSITPICDIFSNFQQFFIMHNRQKPSFWLVIGNWILHN